MIPTIILMLWGTLTEPQRHDFLVRVLEIESKKPDNLVHRSLVETVRSALNNEIPEDQVLHRLMEVMSEHANA